MILGDLFDTVKPSPQIVTETGIRLPTDIPVIVLEANHDQVSMQKGDHSLGPLGLLDNVIVVDEPTLWQCDKSGLVLCLIPHQPGPASEWLPKTVRGLNPPSGALLCMHLGLMDDNVPPYMAATHDAIHYERVQELCAEFDLAGAISGNWHRTKRWDVPLQGPESPTVPLIQCGALAPTGFDNPGLEGYGAVWYWGAENEFTLRTVGGPRFVKFGCWDLLTKFVDNEVPEQADGRYFYLRAVVDPAEISALKSEVQAIKEKRPNIMAVELVVDKKIVEGKARTAARLASDASTLDEALKSYVKAMSLDDGVDREEVVTKCFKYLSR